MRNGAPLVFNGTTSIKDWVYVTLKNQIIMGSLKPGEQLNISELCSSMDISAAPMREALNLLAKDGFITLNPRKHATVTNLAFEGIDTIIYLRSTIEPYAAKLSVDKIPQERIDDMRKVLLGIMDRPTDPEAYIASDLALHELLHQYANSRLLSEIISTVKEHSIRVRYCIENFDKGDSDTLAAVTRATTGEHLSILDAIEARDGDKVYKRVYEHIMNYSDRLHRITEGQATALPHNS